MADETENVPRSAGAPNGSSGDEPAPARLGRAARRGRRVGQFLYYAMVGAIAVASTAQITRQVFFPPPAEVPPPFQGCRAGLVALFQAIEQGRAAAERGDDRDEEAALVRYREAVGPIWRHRDAVAALCQVDPNAIGALDAIERLRYSEEHSVRHQAVELTALRRQVKELVGMGLEPARR